MLSEIDRRTGLSYEEFVRSYASRSLPVILTDATRHWPARTRWSFDFFESHHGDKQVTFEGRQWRIGDLIRQLRRGPTNGVSPYLNMVKLDEQFPELWADMGSLAVARFNRLRSRLLPYMMRLHRGMVALFIGTEGSGFRLLHWDSTKLNVFISQIIGDKDFIVFHPDDTPYLYAKDDIYDSNHSLLPDPFRVDLAAYPAFANARPMRFTLKEGETLFLPAGWWHATAIRQPNIAIAESALDAHNWAERHRWYQDRYRLPSSGWLKRYVLRHVLRVYMYLAHAVLSVKEARG